MNFLFESSSWIVSSTLIVVPSIVICLAALWFIRKKLDMESLKKHHDVAGFTFSIIGILYSVILGFTVINVQERYNEAVKVIHNEAMVIADLYRSADFFMPQNRDAIRSHLKSYVTYIMQEEWFIKDKKSNRRLEAEKTLSEIWNDYYNIEIDSEKTKIWYQESISKLDDLMNARIAREYSSWDHLGSMMWSLLIIGGVITMTFMFFFGLENVRTHMIMTALLAGYISFMLYLVFSLDNVFQGPQGIKPVAFEQLHSLFTHWDGDEPISLAE
jgi:hypothetical protein